MATIKRCRPSLGTFVEITLTDDRVPPHLLEDMTEMAFGRIARVQSLMGFRDPASELSRLSACGHLHPLPVNEWTREVIAEAMRLSRASEGVFDIALSAPPAAGVIASPSAAPVGVPTLAKNAEPPSHRDIILHRDGRVSFRRPLELDLTEIARGYAVDKAAELLVEQRIQQAVINAGGDIRFVGTRPRSLPLGAPAAPQSIHLNARVTASAVATSAAYFANGRHHWRKQSHIMHPRTGKAMRSNVSLSVFAPTCVQADALLKVVLLDEPSAWQSLLEKERASAVFITSAGEMVRFPAMQVAA